MTLEEIHQYWRYEFETKLLPQYLNSIERCYYCGCEVYDLATHEQYTGIRPPREQEQTRDHFIPKSKGGQNTPNNIVIACRRCNTLKGDSIWMTR